MIDRTKFREAVRIAIETYLITNWTRSEIAMEDNEFDSEGNLTWIRPAILYGEPYDGEKGDTGLSIQPGLIKIAVATPVGGGVVDNNTILDELEELFKFKSLDNGMIEIGNPWSTPGLAKNGFHWSTMNVPFITYKGFV